MTRFVTERDEAVHNDCTVCATVMTFGWGTNDLIYRKPDGTDMTNAEVKALRERIRALSGDMSGGTAIEDNVIGGEKQYPWMDIWCAHLPLSTIDTRLRAGWAGVVQGNPIGVARAASPFRRWTNNDNYGHAVKLGPIHADKVHLQLQDPMGFGTYNHDWVTFDEAHQFMRPMRRADSTYHTLIIPEGSLMSTTTTIEKGAPRPFSVPAGTRKIGYRLDPKSGRYALTVDKTLAAPLTGTGYVVNIAQYPAAQKPTGAALLVVTASDPAFAGTTLGMAAVALREAPAPGTIDPAKALELPNVKAAIVQAGKLARNGALDEGAVALSRLKQ